MNKPKFDYYCWGSNDTAPPQEVFDDIKKNAIKIWKTYDDEFGYATKKINAIKDLENIKDNAWFIVAMFDPINQEKLLLKVKPLTAFMILISRAY